MPGADRRKSACLIRNATNYTEAANAGLLRFYGSGSPNFAASRRILHPACHFRS